MACLQVPLGVLIKNENKYEDMISIMEHNHQYVPTTTTNMEIKFPVLSEKLKMEKKKKFHTLLFGGDQLTAKRARGSQMIRCNSIISTQQINGLLPTAEDWHAKLCFLEVCRTVYTHTLLSLAYLMILNYLDICYVTIDKN